MINPHSIGGYHEKALYHPSHEDRAVLSTKGASTLSAPPLQAPSQQMAARENPTHGEGLIQQYWAQPVGRVIAVINPIVRGWVNYFRIGHASRCLTYVKDWVERKVRRHMMRVRHRRGFGWKRWSKVWLYTVLGLYGDYRVRYGGSA